MPFHKTPARFKDRHHAGELLGQVVAELYRGDDIVVLGLPRGGVPVAEVVASRCGAPLDILVVRKIGTPGHEELAAGAIASGGIVVWNEDVLRARHLKPSDLTEVVESEEREVRAREQSLRPAGLSPIDLKNQRVIIVDDGVATGATVRAAVRAVKRASPKEVVVALPVGPEDTCSDLEVDEGCRVVCLNRVDSSAFGSVGAWYEDFSQVDTVKCYELLRSSHVGGQHPHLKRTS